MVCLCGRGAGDMDPNKIIEIIKAMEDGALDPEEARELLQIMIKILDLIKPNLRKRWAKILLIGVSGTLEELQEHIEEIQ